MKKKTHLAAAPGKLADDFAAAVVAARVKLGLTQGAFARLLDTPLGTVRGWEQGRRKPPPCAMLLMRVAVEHPHVFVGGAECDSERAVPAQKSETAGKTKSIKPPGKTQDADKVVATLHEPGDDVDFWLL